MCGIIGLTNVDNASLEVFRSLLLLQHRGQDSAGILSYEVAENKFHLKKELGLLSSVFKSTDFEELKGEWALGHTRYSTIGKIDKNDIQPITQNFPLGFGAVHNGNIENVSELKEKLDKGGHHLISNNDLEILIQLIANAIIKNPEANFANQLLIAAKNIFQDVRGGYSFISIIAKKGLFAFCDPFGIRPLVLGKKNQSFILASESNVLSFLGYDFVRDILPGEIIFIDFENNLYAEILTEKPSRPCMFEWVYFSSVESKWKNLSTYQVRLDLGNRLALKIKKQKIQIDLVSPVPDTGRSSAIGLSETLGIPYREVLIKNRYVQRSFILNTEAKRKEAVDLKFSVVKELVEGKNVLLVDDSIVRGTSSKKIISLLKKYKANKIYLASTCPPIKHPCFYGIDFPRKDDLIMNNLNSKELALELGCEQVFFTDIEDLNFSLKTTNYCSACLTGDYPYGT